MADAETDAKIAAAWPRSWSMSNSKGRNQLRRRWRTMAELAALQSQGASCGSCKHFEPTPDINHRTPWCGLHSDFQGYQTATKDGLCVDWKGQSNA